ncbi:hypothetical protein OG21DRAFT_1490726 [Imleria badia]|nr:hypothetical protein OG21DRAFT_1490726 [Imleria badia]
MHDGDLDNDHGNRDHWQDPGRPDGDEDQDDHGDQDPGRNGGQDEDEHYGDQDPCGPTPDGDHGDQDEHEHDRDQDPHRPTPEGDQDQHRRPDNHNYHRNQSPIADLDLDELSGITTLPKHIHDLSLIRALQTASLDDGIGLSGDALARLHNPPQEPLQLDPDLELTLSIFTTVKVIENLRW